MILFSVYSGDRRRKKASDLPFLDRIEKAQNARGQLRRHLTELSKVFPKQESLKLWLAYLRQIENGLHDISSEGYRLFDDE